MSQKIAIVGVGCRLPGDVDSPESFWTFLSRGGDGVGPTPEDRWCPVFEDVDRTVAGKTYVNRAGYLTQPLQTFDAEFFGISPREAATLDPQQRLLLEVTQEAFDDAGVPRSALKGSPTGVFVGGFTLDNFIAVFAPDNLDRIGQHTATSSSMTLMSNRLSYVFDLKGPSLTLDTACSSSLVATHLACRSLLSGECDLAVASGVNVMLLPNYQIVMCKGGFLAADGRSKSFDARGDGYGRGEGAVSVILKRYEEAVADGDLIRGVILGTGVNQDGTTNGIAQPSQDAQATLISRVCSQFGIDPKSIEYVEAHGTGTRAGDPIEMGAIGRNYGTNRSQPLPVGSVKANIGHLEAAAGLAGMLKAVLSVQHRQVPPQINFFEPNPDIDFEGLNVVVSASARALEGECPRAAVNSFGYGGTNAHVIVEGHAHPTQPAPVSASRQLFVLTGRTENALKQFAESVLKVAEDVSPGDLAGTLALRRTHFEERAAFFASDTAELRAGLESIREKKARTATSPGLVWVYTGMGPQWWAMGRELYQSEPVFRAAVDEASTAVERYTHSPLLHEMFRERHDSRMHRNDVAQPANFVIQVALTRLLRSKGFEPDLIVGHSVGEIAAAWAAGCLSLEDAACVVGHRAMLLQKLAGRGAMVALGCSESEAEDLMLGLSDIGIAARNGRESVTVSGSNASIEALEVRASQIFCKRVRVEVAYHSAQMEEIKMPFLDALAKLSAMAPKVPLVSTVSGELIEASVHDADYWWRNARQPVELNAAMSRIVELGYSNFLEVGPHPVLAPSIEEILGGKGVSGAIHAAMVRQGDEVEVFERGLCALVESGVNPDFSKILPAGWQMVRLPNYPWQRERHWDDSIFSNYVGQSPKHPFGEAISDETGTVTKGRLDGSALAYLRDHVVQGQPILPGAAYVEAALAATRVKTSSATISNVRFLSAMGMVGSGEVQTLRTQVRSYGEIVISGRVDDEDWSVKARAVAEESKYLPSRVPDNEGAERIDPGVLYAALARRKLEYGPAFQTVTSLAVKGDEVWAEIDGRMRLAPADFNVHPSILDGAFQALFATQLNTTQTWLPVEIERVTLFSEVGLRARVYGRVTEIGVDILTGDLVLSDPENGEVLLEVKGLKCQRVESSGTTVVDSMFHRIDWREIAIGELAENSVVLVSPNPDLHNPLQSVFVSLGMESQMVAEAELTHSVEGEHVVWVIDVEEDHPGEALTVDALHAVQTLINARPKQVTILTFGAHGFACEVNPAQRAVWGFARVLMTEHPELNVRLVDGPPLAEIRREEIEAIARAIGEVQHHEESVIRGSLRFVPRIQRGRLESEASLVSLDSEPVEVEVARVGDLGSLGFVKSERNPPAPNEIEVRVVSASLNFKDVMKALGMLSEKALESTYLGRELGLEASGIVERVGGDVTRFVPGERVFLYKGGTLRSFVNVDQRFAVHCLPEMSHQDGATMFVFLTAWYALINRANLRQGERVLIHSAAGGVGMAAVQIALAFGAEVFTSVGTEGKREHLKAMGITKIYDSRSLNFADEILADTQGEGVDIVLNALAGRAIERGLACLAPGGRFVELGKKDIADDRPLGLLPFNRNLSFISVDLDRMAEERPSFFVPLAEEVCEAFGSGRLRALPQSEFSAAKVEDAFRALASGNQIGKVVLNFSGEVSARSMPGRFTSDPEAAYLVTGGLGGFGLETARWLVDNGVRHVWLASRRGEARGEDAEILRQIGGGATVYQAALDVTKPAEVEQLIQRIEASGRPLKGVFHAAAVIQDEMIKGLTASAMRATLGAKARGAQVLDVATRSVATVEHFVLFSSISALVGNPGQAAYAAANAYLEGLVERRIARGLPGLVIGWGAIRDAGVVARDHAIEDHLRLLGIHAIDSRVALEAMGQLAPNSGYMGVVDIDWDRWAESMSETPWSRLEDVRQKNEELASDSESSLDALASLVARVFGMAQERVDLEKPLRDMGLDSIMAAELQSNIARALGVEVSVMELLAGKGLRSLANKLESRDVRTIESNESSEPVKTMSVRAEDGILVCAPYYALTDLKPNGQWIEAQVLPDDHVSLERSSISSAEVGRHLAILGSIAASLHSKAPASRHVYPVKRALLHMEELEATPGTCTLRSRCTSYDSAANRAVSEGEMLDGSGRLVGRLEVEYHVIEERQFRRMMQSHALPTAEHLADLKTYRNLNPELRVVRSQSGLAEMHLDVKPEICLGHFAGIPTLPVSIMGRFVVDAVGQASGDRFMPVVERAEIHTHRFVFVGEVARFVASVDGPNARCEVFANEELAAVFELILV